MKQIWDPKVYKDGTTLGFAYQDLVTNYQDKLSKVPVSIKLMENPLSPIALPGAVSLKRHDLIHILLALDTSLQGEYLVVGFTMGTARKLRSWHLGLFKWWVMHFYPHKYRGTEQDWAIFDRGIALGQQVKVKDLHKVRLEHMVDQPIGALRERFGIEIQRVQQILL